MLRFKVGVCGSQRESEGVFYPQPLFLVNVSKIQIIFDNTFRLPKIYHLFTIVKLLTKYLVATHSTVGFFKNFFLYLYLHILHRFLGKFF